MDRNWAARLHQLRQERQENDEALAASRQEWEDDNSVCLDNKRFISQEIEELERGLKAQRVEMYDGKDKSRLLGIGIRVKSGIEFNSDKAFAWGKEHNLALQLDRKRFVEMANPIDMDFVTATEEITATIATDLSKYLDGNDG